MKLPAKILIGSGCALVFIVLIGFVVFPKVIVSQVKGMVSLKPGNQIRDFFLKVPFALTFRIYLFNVTNPMEVQRGEKPILHEMGPFCYEEWKEKVNVEDHEEDDTIIYNPKDTFIHQIWPGCLTGEEEVTIPHPMILGVVNTVSRQKPGALTLVNKALKSIYSNPTSIFVTAKAKDILFEGILIHCGVKDFAGKAICSQLKAAPSLKHVNEDDLAFSFFGPKNATPGKAIKAYRGIQESHNLGTIILYDEKPTMDVWNNTKCNQILGTDGTIFPPFLTKEEGLASFAPDLCRSLTAEFDKKDKYDGIPVSSYFVTLGDMSKNADEKCYCLTPDTCLKKGMMDLYLCSGAPVYASLPHFYDADASYLNGVKGLKPNKTEHEIRILFESTTGSPVYAKKRLQFSMPLEPNPKVELFFNFTPTVLPLFWIEEGVELNITYTKQLKDFFGLKKTVSIVKYLILIGSIGGLGAGGYLFFKQSSEANLTPVHKVKPAASDSVEQIMNNNGFGEHLDHREGIENYGKY